MGRFRGNACFLLVAAVACGGASESTPGGDAGASSSGASGGGEACAPSGMVPTRACVPGTGAPAPQAITIEMDGTLCPCDGELGPCRVDVVGTEIRIGSGTRACRYSPDGGCGASVPQAQCPIGKHACTLPPLPEARRESPSFRASDITIGRSSSSIRAARARSMPIACSARAAMSAGAASVRPPPSRGTRGPATKHLSVT